MLIKRIAVFAFVLLLPRLALADDMMAKRLADVEDRLDQVEKSTLLDRVQFGGEYRVIFNSFQYSGPSPSPYDLPDPMNPFGRRKIKSSTEEVWSHRMRLTLRATPIKSLRFTGRLVMFRHFGDGDAPAFVQDSVASRTPRDTGVRFDQIWIDWFATSWLAFSAGRIAYSEGNPNELRENSTVRRGTWGLHMVDGEYESINATFNLGSLSKIFDRWYARLFYASWFFDNDDPLGGFPFIESGTENLRIIGGNFDIVIPKIGRNFVQIGYYVVPQFRPFMIPIADPGYNPANNYAAAPPPFDGSLLFPSKMPESLGSYQNVSLLVELYDIAGSGLDFFGSFSLGFLNPNDKAIEYNLPAGSGGARVSTPFLALSSQGSDDNMTFFGYAGFRYTMPFWTEPKVGFEFNYGSRYHISFATLTDQLLNKLSTRGKAYEAYAIIPFNEHLFLRLTYLFIDSDYQAGFFGPHSSFGQTTAPEFKQEIHNFQAVLNARL
jgi:hypothetical protein